MGEGQGGRVLGREAVLAVHDHRRGDGLRGQVRPVGLDDLRPPGEHDDRPRAPDGGAHVRADPRPGEEPVELPASAAGSQRRTPAFSSGSRGSPAAEASAAGPG
ncbi:hypothetical protein, partial [Streptomyces somaliensis]|uniref:hypothetical protein n=1 Tax=Streptomyces somaliensis TaxID=78355 RepID=UPI00263B7151